MWRKTLGELLDAHACTFGIRAEIAARPRSVFGFRVGSKQ
jgi:hypothetical protein